MLQYGAVLWELQACPDLCWLMPQPVPSGVLLCQICRKLPLALASPVGQTHPRLLTPLRKQLLQDLGEDRSGLPLELKVWRSEACLDKVPDGWWVLG